MAATFFFWQDEHRTLEEIATKISRKDAAGGTEPKTEAG